MRSKNFFVFDNVLMAIAQVICSGVTLFILYYYLYRALGPSQLGIWSVVLSTASASKFSDLGISGGVVKFVAQSGGNDDAEKTAAIIQTATLSTLSIVGLISIAMYPVASWLIGKVLPAENLTEAISILPYAILSLWINSIGTVFLSSLDGFFRTDLRSKIVMLSSIGYLIAAILLTDRLGLKGLALAQVIQSAAIVFASWFLLRKIATNLPIVPQKWTQKYFREMFSYGVNFQFTTLIQLILDPITKLLLSKFGGLGSVGIYEMASRMISQVRSLLISANQVIVPLIARESLNTKNNSVEIYAKSYRTIFYVLVPLFGTMAAQIPLISQIWLGKFEPTFALFAAMLISGWFVNTLSGPAFFSNLGTGRLYANTLGQLTVMVTNAVAGLTLGYIFGGPGVVAAFAIALSAGAAVVIAIQHSKNAISYKDLLPRESWPLAGCSALSIAISWPAYFLISGQTTTAIALPVLLLISLGLLAPSLYFHPLTSQLLKELINYKKRKVSSQ